MGTPVQTDWAQPTRRIWRSLRRWTVTITLIYVGFLLVLILLERSFIYHPVKHQSHWVPATDPAIQDVWVKTEDGTRIHAWWCPVEHPQWYVLYAHGNAGNLSHRQPGIRNWQHHLGASVLIFDYPGYGKSDGKPSEPGCYAAAHAAYRWLVDEQQVPADRIVLYGGSLGGAMAVELAMQVPHRALVLLSPFTSIPDMAQQMFPWTPARWLVRTRFDNLSKLQTYHGPLFIGHGCEDTMIPCAHGERLVTASPSKHKQYFPIPAAGHNDCATPAFYEAVARFVRDAQAVRRSESP